MILVYKNGDGVAMMSFSTLSKLALKRKDLEDNNIPYAEMNVPPEAEQDKLYFDENGEFKERVASSYELFISDMNNLNEEYDKNTLNLSFKFLNASSRDGTQEATKVASVRAEIAALDAQYESDKLAIINKYYGA